MTPSRRWRESHGWERNGELTATGESQAEYEQECRAGYWDPPAEFDPPSPGGHGWADDFYPNSNLV